MGQFPAFFVSTLVSFLIASSDSPGGAARGPDVFGSVAIGVGHTPLDEKWRQATPDLRRLPKSWVDARGALARLRGLDRLRAANSFVNRNVVHVDDWRLYGQRDRWAPLDQTARLGRGDCEDFAIAKMHLLQAAGVAPEDLYLVLARDVVRQVDHALLVVRDDQRLYVLDSQTDLVLDAQEVRDYQPVLSFGHARAWVHGFRHRPIDLRLAEGFSPGGP